MERQKKPKNDHTKNGVCSGCGGCCGNFLPLTKADKERIHKHLKKHILAPYDGTPLDCPFLNDTPGKRCSIYAIRPLICKEYVCNKRPTRSELEKLAAKKMQFTDMRQEFFGRWLK